MHKNILNAIGNAGMHIIYRLLPGWVKKTKQVPFLNYGFIDPNQELPSGENSWNKNQQNLYFRVIAPILEKASTLAPTNSLTIVEIGSGLGIGAAWISHLLKGTDRAIIGIDLSKEGIRFCQKQYPDDPALSFFQGNAMNIPLPQESADAVVNVESSHMYPDFNQFLSEVDRILKPGGLFCWADFRPQSEIRETLAAIKAKFSSTEEDITEGVVRSLILDHSRKELYLEQILQGMNPAVRFLIKYLFRQQVRNFLGMQGTPFFERMESKSVLYFLVIARKSAS